jgi:hypothetical protein
MAEIDLRVVAAEGRTASRIGRVAATVHRPGPHECNHQGISPWPIRREGRRMWTCPNCAEENDDDAPSCAVCATRAQPTVVRAAPGGAPLSTLREPTPPVSPGLAASAPLQSTDDVALWQPADPMTPTRPPAATTSALPPVSPVGEVRPPLAPPYAIVTAADPPPSRSLPARWILAAALVLFVGLGATGAIVAPRFLRSEEHDNQAADGAILSVASAAAVPAEPTTDAPDPTDTPTEERATAPTAVGIVAIDPALTDGRADDVATMFDVYFQGINDKDYDSVGSVLDPAGSIDPGDLKQMAALAKGTRSTQDSAVTLMSLSDVADGLLAAEVTFRSRQRAGDGPRGRTGETCTRWDIVYTISAATEATYQIRKSRATSSPC